MKKILSCFLAAMLLLGMVVLPVSSAGYASMSGPGTVRAGDTITVSFVAGGGIYGGSGTLSYDSNALTLQSISGAMSTPWAVEISGNNFVFYDNSMKSPLSSGTVLKATFKVSASAATGSTISVSANNVVVSDGVTDTGIGACTYSAVIAAPLSGNANLASLTVSNANISPAFSAATTQYSASVPFSTSVLQVSATAEHPGATVVVSNTSLAANGTTNVNITVTAENGTTKTYIISTFRARDPNYVESSVNTLDSLSVEGFLLSPAFTADKQDYAIYVSYEVESVSVSAEKTHNLSSVAVPTIEGLPVGESLYQIVVTAENGDEQIYTLTVFRAEPFDKTIVIPEQTEPPTVPEETTEPATEPSAETTQPPTEPTEPAEPEETGSDFWWIVVLAAIIGCGIGCGAAVLYFKRKKKA